MSLKDIIKEVRAIDGEFYIDEGEMEQVAIRYAQSLKDSQICGNCKHWMPWFSNNSDIGFARCDKIEHKHASEALEGEIAVVEAYDFDSAGLHVKADFGCVLFESKELKQ